MSPAKPREFFICQGKERGKDFVCTGNKTRQFEGLHVIEHSAFDKAVKIIQRTSKYLNEDIAMLDCTSRIRTMEEDTWEVGMMLRDVMDEFLAKVKE